MTAPDPATSAGIISTSETATQAIAAALARLCHPGDCILLKGELGAGKTAFARGFIQALSPQKPEVVSPTFTLLQTYPAAGGGMIWHFDLYRLEAPDEVREIGLEDALQSGITLVEWPDIARAYLPKDALEVRIETGSEPDTRHLTFAGNASVWNNRLQIIKGSSS